MAQFEGMYEILMRSLSAPCESRGTLIPGKFTNILDDVFPIRSIVSDRSWVSPLFSIPNLAETALEELRRETQRVDMNFHPDAFSSVVPIDTIPDDTALSWGDWNAKVDALLAECGEEAG